MFTAHWSVNHGCTLAWRQKKSPESDHTAQHPLTQGGAWMVTPIPFILMNDLVKPFKLRVDYII